jgi:hypothetical protein
VALAGHLVNSLVLDSRPDRQLLHHRLLFNAGALARRAQLLDDGALPSAGVAGTGEYHGTGLEGLLACAFAGVARGWLGAWLGSAAVAGGADLVFAEFYLLLGAFYTLLEGDVHSLFYILTLVHEPLPRPFPPKDIIDDVLERAKPRTPPAPKNILKALSESRPALSKPSRLVAGHAGLVVDLALGVVAERLVGTGQHATC